MLGNKKSSPRKALFELLTQKGYSYQVMGHDNSYAKGLSDTHAHHSCVSDIYLGDENKAGMLQLLAEQWNKGTLLAQKPRNIFLMLGSNDIMNGYELDNAPKKLRKVIDQLYALPNIGNPNVCVATIPPNKSKEAHRTNVIIFNEMLLSIVKDYKTEGRNVFLVDQYKALEDDFKNAMGKDKVHPSKKGDEIIANQWLEGIEKAKSSIDISTKVEELSSTIPNAYPGEKGEFHGYDTYDFKLEGSIPVKIVAPKKPAPGKPWLWRSLFWQALSKIWQAYLQLVEEGYHVVIVYGDVSGHPKGNKNIDAAYKFLTSNYGFSKKCSMAVAMSRGDLSLFRWANANPEKVESIYVDNGVCNIRSWPAGNKVPGNSHMTGDGSKGSWEQFKEKINYQTDEEALNSKQSPIDLLEPIAKAKVPILTVCGSKDMAVPYEENDKILEERYKKLGGDIMVIIEDKGHSHGMNDPTPVLEFIRKHTKANQ